MNFFNGISLSTKDYKNLLTLTLIDQVYMYKPGNDCVYVYMYDREDYESGVLSTIKFVDISVCKAWTRNMLRQYDTCLSHSMGDIIMGSTKRAVESDDIVEARLGSVV